MSRPPLPARMRPTSLEEVVGQPHLTAPDAPFRKAVESGEPPSVLLWGPPGSGKTTIARLLAERSGLRFLRLSAVTDGIKELRALLQQAEDALALERRGSLLFIDEIHRWNKAQQDALLPHVEEGRIRLVGATTENPAFQVIPALRSRCWVVQLRPLEPADLLALLQRALADEERGLGDRELKADEDALAAIADLAGGDARRALAILEQASQQVRKGGRIDVPLVGRLAQRKDLGHDRSGDAHYDVVSAFIKSLRGSNPDAALYWMARMIEGGEDPVFIARRMVIFAAEDVGNADPRALPLAVSAMQGAHLVGMPEARIILGQACTYLATAPKSNAAYMAIDAALEAVRQAGALPVPIHLRNAPTDLAKSLGHGAEYLYPHDYPGHIVAQQYLPDALQGARFYEPTEIAGEKQIRDRLAWWEKQLRERDDAGRNQDDRTSGRADEGRSDEGRADDPTRDDPTT